MEDQGVWAIILTSAGVAAVISLLGSLINASLDRNARRQELLLSKAVDIAIVRSERALAIWQASEPGTKLTLQDDIVSVETYYGWLKELWRTGSLPPDADLGRS